MKFILAILFFISTVYAQQTIKDLTVNDLKVVNTKKGSKPCPLMTETQRNALVSPLNGQCVYNTTTSKLNVYNGTIWKAAGGGIDIWATSFTYAADDLVIESNKIYRSLIAHTSGTFATDLGAGRWVELSDTEIVDLATGVTGVLALTNGGTGSSSKNFVDLTTGQTIAGLKQFSDPVGIGGAANANAVLDVQSTTKAFLPPRMTTAQMSAIPSPVEGMTVYNTDFDATASYNGTTWVYGFGFLNLDDIYSAKVSISAVVSDENIDWIDGNCTNTNPTVCTLKGFTVVPNCWTGAGNVRIVSYSAQGVATISIDQYDDTGAPTRSNFSLYCQKTGTDYLSASSNAYATSNADTDWQAYTPASFQGFGTATDVEFFWRKQGPNIQIRGAFTSGTVDANEARISLPTGVTSADATKIPSLTAVGVATTRWTDVASTTNVTATLIEPSVTYVTFQRYANSILTKGAGNQVHSSSSKMTMFAELPVQGWASSPFIVGSFQGYNYTAGVNNVDSFSVSYGTTNATTACSASPCSYLDQIGNAVTSITRSGAGSYTLNTSRTYSKIKCTYACAISGGNGCTVPSIYGENTNAVSFVTVAANTGSASNSYGNLDCKGSY